jgi:hypothetical protein
VKNLKGLGFRTLGETPGTICSEKLRWVMKMHPTRELREAGVEDIDL